jgi:hypothetical protein
VQKHFAKFEQYLCSCAPTSNSYHIKSRRIDPGGIL